VTTLRSAVLLLSLLALSSPALGQASLPATGKALVAAKAPAKAVATAKATGKAVAKAPGKAPAKAVVTLAKPPASQPASAPAPVVARVVPPAPPAVVKPAWKSLLDNNWVRFLVGLALLSLINGLKKKSVREGLIGCLESLLDYVSLTTNRNTVGTFKMLLTRSGQPVAGAASVKPEEPVEPEPPAEG